jgi:CRISPR-associated protein Cas1
MGNDDLRTLPKIRDSLSYAYVEHARLEQSNRAVAVWAESGIVELPCAALAAVLLGPGTTVTHAAIKTLADAGCSIVWVGEGITRVYAQGHGETKSARRLLAQARCHADPRQRAAVVRRLYERRFAEGLEDGLTLEQVRGMEGARVRTAYARLAQEHGVEWRGRSYVRGNWGAADAVNQALSTAASCLYSVVHAAVVSAGYSTALGFIHTGKLLAFVYDIADLYRLEVVVPVAFRAAAKFRGESRLHGLSSEVRRGCRDAFREHGLMSNLVTDIDDVLAVTESDLEAAGRWLQANGEEVVALWDPLDGEIEGGGNHADGGTGTDAGGSEG